MDEDIKDKEKIIQYFYNKRLKACFIKKEETKTPDFEIYLDNTLFAYCELKSIIKNKRIVGLCNDPAYNRIQNKIHEACKQLKAINPEHKTPNIIIIISHDKGCNVGDLDIVTKGKFSSTKGEVDFDTRYRNRLLKKGDLKDIDLIVWIDDNNNNNNIYFRYITESIFKNQLKNQLSFHKTYKIK